MVIQSPSEQKVSKTQSQQTSQMQWQAPVIPATQEAWVGRSLSEACLRQICKTLSKKKKKKQWFKWYGTSVPPGGKKKGSKCKAAYCSVI
jgi:hypothetical protein